MNQSSAKPADPVMQPLYAPAPTKETQGRRVGGWVRGSVLKLSFAMSDAARPAVDTMAHTQVPRAL